MPSSPHYPQFNGLAESAVKKLKYLIAKLVDSHGSLVIQELDKGLRELRNTSAENGLSVAQMVFGQELRSILPSIRASLLKESRKNYYDQHYKTMPELCMNQRVRNAERFAEIPLPKFKSTVLPLIKKIADSIA